jgi:hypothetical protein
VSGPGRSAVNEASGTFSSGLLAIAFAAILTGRSFPAVAQPFLFFFKLYFALRFILFSGDAMEVESILGRFKVLIERFDKD